MLPIISFVGLNELIAELIIVNVVKLMVVSFPLFTTIFPVVAPLGTVIVNEVMLPSVILAILPFIFTVFDAKILLKPVPVIITVDPKSPEVGVNELI